jgi:tetratricopeptide (TPR) repeat protein
MSIETDAPTWFRAGIERAAQRWLACLQPQSDPRALPPRALDHALRCLGWCLEADQCPELAIDLALALHTAMIRIGQWQAWEPCLRQVVATCAPQVNPERRLSAQNSLCAIWFRMGYLDEAIELAEQNRKFAVDTRNVALHYAAASILAEAYLNADSHDLALHYAEETIALAAVTANKALEADGWINAARALLGLQAFAEADWRLWQAHALALAAGDVVYQAKARLFMGHSTARRGLWQEAVAHFEAARTLVTSYGDEVGRATVQSNLGWVLTELGRWDEAACLLEDAVRILHHHGNAPAERNALRRLSDLENRRTTAPAAMSTEVLL